MKKLLSCLTVCLLGSIAALTGAQIPVIFDTDANNELDDQHALAYLLLNEGIFDVIGVTVNATASGGGIENHYQEAVRVVDLSGKKEEIPVYRGADSDFTEIRDHLDEDTYDGAAAVEFMIREAKKERPTPLVLLAVGKLTNVALALEKEPSIAGRVRVVWLGSNYPGPGEYNMVNDTASMNYVLQTEVPFELVTVRYGEPSGTAAVKVTRHEIYTRMPGTGPEIETPVEGRHGGEFNCFGDYSVSLFRHIDHLEDGCYRSLFDMAAVAIVKDPSWAESSEIPCPVLVNGQWQERPGNQRKIILWENFDREKIMQDFYTTLQSPIL